MLHNGTVLLGSSPEGSYLVIVPFPRWLLNWVLIVLIESSLLIKAIQVPNPERYCLVTRWSPQ